MKSFGYNQVSKCIDRPYELSLSEYDEFRADLDLVGYSMERFSEELGVTVQRMYAWKQKGGKVPRYARSYIERLMEIRTLKGVRGEVPAD